MIIFTHVKKTVIKFTCLLIKKKKILGSQDGSQYLQFIKASLRS